MPEVNYRNLTIDGKSLRSIMANRSTARELVESLNDWESHRYVEHSPSQLLDPSATDRESNSYTVSEEDGEQSDPTAGAAPQATLLPGVRFVKGVGYVVGEEVPEALAGRMDREQIAEVREAKPKARKAGKAATDKVARKQANEKLMAMGDAERAAFIRFSGIARRNASNNDEST